MLKNFSQTQMADTRDFLKIEGLGLRVILPFQTSPKEETSLVTWIWSSQDVTKYNDMGKKRNVKRMWRREK